MRSVGDASLDDGATTEQVEPVPSSGVESLTLAVIAGPDTGRTLNLEPGRHLVGKHRDCALSLADATVSRQHLELEVDAWGVVVRDLGSKNGSFYHGARFSHVVVGAGAVITIGSTQLRFVRRAERLRTQPSASERFGRLSGDRWSCASSSPSSSASPSRRRQS